MSKGFLIFAQNTDVDYVMQAYALALSIKFSQKEHSSVSIVTNSDVPEQYKSVFDNIIPIPWFDGTVSSLAGEHRWKLYHVSPYDETIVLDADMLMLEDISQWWDYCKPYDVKFCSRVKNYKLETVEQDMFHRRTFIENKLTNPYFALHYFKKSDKAKEFYKVLEFVCNNWEWCYSKFAPELYQDWLSMDLATAISIEITGEYNQVTDVCCPFEFIHMKVPLQKWPVTVAKWQDAVPCVLNTKGDLVVGNIKQSRLFHYVDKDFLTPMLLSRLEELVYGKKTI